MQKKKEEKAITLIALIVTIIVLLILAGVTIATLTGDNGLLQKATASKQANEEGVALEKIKVEVAGSYGLDGKIDKEQLVKNLKKINGLTYNGDSLSDTNKIIKLPSIVKLSGFSFTIKADGRVEREKTVDDYPEIAVNVLAMENSRYISNNKMAVIPKGYTISGEITEQSIDTGLVIKKDGNEWVWIPVNSTDLAAMYTEDENGWTISGTSGEDAVVTKYKSLGSIVSDYYGVITRVVNPGDVSDRREPDMLSQNGRDNNSTNLTVVGYKSYKDMAENLRDDYKNMIESIKKYGGFYVGRYELSNLGTQKNQNPLTDVNWYELYAKCKTLGSEDTETRMIWGVQWDQVCKFISTAKDANGDIISLTNSSKYGNLNDAVAPANQGNYEKGKKKNTGSNEAWKTNNIYDFAGNCHEWTQEAHWAMERVNRGGDYGSNGTGPSVAGRWK